MAFRGFLKQNTATTIKVGPFYDDTDGKTAETALTLSQADVRLAKNGGNMAQKNETSSCTHDEIGVYDCAIDATDTNTLGRLSVNILETGALGISDDYIVLPANIYDSWMGTDKQEVDLAQIAGAVVDTASAQLGVNVVTIVNAYVPVKKNVSIPKFTFYMELDAGGPATGKTVTAQVSKDGGSFGTVSDTVAEIGSGFYEVDLSATELNADVVAFKATATACKQRNITFLTGG